MRWWLFHPSVTSTIILPSTPQHIDTHTPPLKKQNIFLCCEFFRFRDLKLRDLYFKILFRIFRFVSTFFSLRSSFLLFLRMFLMQKFLTIQKKDPCRCNVMSGSRSPSSPVDCQVGPRQMDWTCPRKSHRCSLGLGSRELGG